MSPLGCPASTHCRCGTGSGRAACARSTSHRAERRLAAETACASQWASRPLLLSTAPAAECLDAIMEAASAHVSGRRHRSQIPSDMIGKRAATCTSCMTSSPRSRRSSNGRPRRTAPSSCRNLIAQAWREALTRPVVRHIWRFRRFAPGSGGDARIDPLDAHRPRPRRASGRSPRPRRVLSAANRR